MISMLISLLVILIVFGVGAWIVTLIPLPVPFRQIALAVLGIACILMLLSVAGLLPAWVR